MKSTMERLEHHRVRLTSDVPSDEFPDGTALGLAVACTTRIPFQAIDHRTGTTVLPQAVERALLTQIFAAAREHDLHLLGRPEVTLTEVDNGRPVKFTAVADLRPEIDLPDLASIHVVVATVTVDDHDIDDELDRLRRRYPIPAADPATTDTLPALDDAFAQLVSDCETLQELRDDLLAELTSRGRAGRLAAARDDALRQIVAATAVPAPQSLVRDEVEHRRQWMHAELERLGTTLAEYLEAAGKTAEDIDALLLDATTDRVRGQLVLDAIADTEDIQTTDAEIRLELARRAERAGVTTETYRGQLIRNGSVGTFVGDVRRGKALALVMERINLTDPTGTALSLADPPTRIRQPA